MNTLRRARPLIAAIGMVVVVASPVAATISASPVQPGESSQTFIRFGSSQSPSFAASPPSGLTVSFSTPVEGQQNDWSVTMTIAAAVDISPGAYSFPITMTGSSGTLADTVAVVVEPPDSLPTTTSTTTTTTTRPPASTTTPTSTPPPATSAAPTSTTPPTTTTSTTTSTPPTTTTSTTTPPTTTVPPTTVAPTTVAPTTVAPTTAAPPPTAAPGQEAGSPGAAIDPSNALPLSVVLPVGATALILVGGIAIVGARRRRFTPAEKGLFAE